MQKYMDPSRIERRKTKTPHKSSAGILLFLRENSLRCSISRRRFAPYLRLVFDGGELLHATTALRANGVCPHCLANLMLKTGLADRMHNGALHFDFGFADPRSHSLVHLLSVVGFASPVNFESRGKA